MFLVKKTRKNIQPMCQKHFEEHIDSLLIREEGKRYYIFIKGFNIFMWEHHTVKENFFSCLQAFSTTEKKSCKWLH